MFKETVQGLRNHPSLRSYLNKIGSTRDSIQTPRFLAQFAPRELSMAKEAVKSAWRYLADTEGPRSASYKQKPLVSSLTDILRPGAPGTQKTFVKSSRFSSLFHTSAASSPFSVKNSGSSASSGSANDASGGSQSPGRFSPFSAIFNKMLEMCSTSHAHQIASRMNVKVEDIRFDVKGSEVHVQVQAPAATTKQIETLGKAVEQECPMARFYGKKHVKMHWQKALPP